jgi:Bacterial regulatory helix-turn-helix protein, lysR family
VRPPAGNGIFRIFVRSTLAADFGRGDAMSMVRINSRQAEAFRAMMLTGSATEAAKLIAVTQPAASRSLRDFQSLSPTENPRDFLAHLSLLIGIRQTEIDVLRFWPQSRSNEDQDCANHDQNQHRVFERHQISEPRLIEDVERR